MRVGSRHNALLTALLAAADAGACTLPPAVVEARARLASVQAVAAAALRGAPDGEARARAIAVRALAADPAEDVIDAVLKARQADAEHRLRVELLSEAVELAADDLDALPDLTAHMQDAHARCTAQLRGAFTTFAPVSTSPDDLWAASPAVRGAWTSFSRASAHYEAILAVWRLVRATSPAIQDHENLFFEVANVDHIWPERIAGLRPVSTMREPWPRRADTLQWLLWMHEHGAVLHLPDQAQQDLAWHAVLGARAAEFAEATRTSDRCARGSPVERGGALVPPPGAPPAPPPLVHPPQRYHLGIGEA